MKLVLDPSFRLILFKLKGLYKKVIEFARFSGNERVIDAYSGIGSIAISISDKVNKVFGVEIVKSAVNDAKRNARINGVKNALFELGNIDKVIGKMERL